MKKLSIGENIRFYRGTIKQDELAEKLGVTPATISRWENNKNIPNGHMLKKMAEIFNIPIDYLADRMNIVPHTSYTLNEPSLELIALQQKIADENTNLKEPITAGRRNNMYIIKDSEHEFCIPDNEEGRKIFLDFLRSSLKGIGLVEQQINNNGMNSSYHNSIVNHETSTATQVEISETA